MIAVAVALLAVAAMLLALLCLMAPYTVARRKAAPTLAPTRVALAVIAAAHLALAPAVDARRLQLQVARERERLGACLLLVALRHELW